MNSRIRRIALAIAFAIILGLVPAWAEAPATVGAEAPDFELTTLNGEVFKLSEQRGKVVFVNIWATWCPPCVDEIPDIQKLAEAHPEELVVIGVSVDDALEDVEAFIEESGITYPVAMEGARILATEVFPTQYIPESVFIAPDGTVASIDISAMTYAQMEERFRKALEGDEEKPGA